MKVGDLVKMKKGYGDSGIGQLIGVIPGSSRRGYGIKQFKVMWPDGTLMAISAAIMERIG